MGEGGAGGSGESFSLKEHNPIEKPWLSFSQNCRSIEGCHNLAAG